MNFELQEKIYYDTLQKRYEEEAKVPFSDYRKLEDRIADLEMWIDEILNLIEKNDMEGLAEYAKELRGSSQNRWSVHVL